jgi:hypothetical protein
MTSNKQGKTGIGKKMALQFFPLNPLHFQSCMLIAQVPAISKRGYDQQQTRENRNWGKDGAAIFPFKCYIKNMALKRWRCDLQLYKDGTFNYPMNRGHCHKFL